MGNVTQGLRLETRRLTAGAKVRSIGRVPNQERSLNGSGHHSKPKARGDAPGGDSFLTGPKAGLAAAWRSAALVFLREVRGALPSRRDGSPKS
jgi:hypothetical protein